MNRLRAGSYGTEENEKDYENEERLLGAQWNWLGASDDET
jgi:hypothetical protein